MGNLAFIGSHSINGVSALHTGADTEGNGLPTCTCCFQTASTTKTNGITPRCWLMQCNPGLTSLIRDAIGDAFMDDAEKLLDLSTVLPGDSGFRDKFADQAAEQGAPCQHGGAAHMGIRVDPSAFFDIQIKRIHEYKRQLLNLIEAVALYDQIPVRTRNWIGSPRVKFWAGKAAPSYHNARLIIKLANDIARVINNDPAVRASESGIYSEL